MFRTIILLSIAGATLATEGSGEDDTYLIGYCCSETTQAELTAAGTRCGPVDANGVPVDVLAADFDQSQWLTGAINPQCFACWNEESNSLDVEQEGCAEAKDANGNACNDPEGFCVQFANENQAAACWTPEINAACSLTPSDHSGGDECPNPMCESAEAAHCGLECIPCITNPVGTTTSGELCSTCVSCVVYAECATGKNPCNSDQADSCKSNCIPCAESWQLWESSAKDEAANQTFAASTSVDGQSCATDVCNGCGPYIPCIDVDTDCGGGNGDNELDELLADAVKGAAAAMGLNAEQVSAFAAFVGGLPENSPLEKMVQDAVLAAFGQTAPSIEALTSTMKTIFTSAAFSTTLGDTEGVDAGVLAAVNTAIKNANESDANESGAAGLALNLAVVAMAAAALL